MTKESDDTDKQNRRTVSISKWTDSQRKNAFLSNPIKHQKLIVRNAKRRGLPDSEKLQNWLTQSIRQEIQNKAMKALKYAAAIKHIS